jgi:hypothetical protein
LREGTRAELQVTEGHAIRPYLAHTNLR